MSRRKKINTTIKQPAFSSEICVKIKDAKEPVPMTLTQKEHTDLLQEFWDADDGMNALIREACNSEVQKKLLDQIIYEYIRERSESMFRRNYFGSCVHAGLTMEDLINSMFVAYYALDLNKVAAQPNPKRYICMTVTNEKNKIYSEEKSMFPVLSKASSSSRKVYKAILAGKTEDIDFDKLKKRTKATAIKVATQNSGRIVSFDQTPTDTENGNGSVGAGAGESDYIDHSASVPYDDIVTRKMCSALTRSMFKDPVAREVFAYTYIYTAGEDLQHKERVKKAAAMMEETYGMSRREYVKYLRDVDAFLAENRESVTKMIYGEAV